MNSRLGFGSALDCKTPYMARLLVSLSIILFAVGDSCTNYNVHYMR